MRPPEIISDLLAYLKELFSEGVGVLFTFFELVGIAVFFLPLQNPQVNRAVGALIFLLSLMIANFMLFRKYRPAALDESSLRLYQHRTQSSNAVHMVYVGKETAEALEVHRVHVNPSGESVEAIINQFFPPTDPQMLLNGGPLWSLEPGQEAYFYLIGEQETRSGITTVHVAFTGAKTHKSVKVTKVFPLAYTAVRLTW